MRIFLFSLFIIVPYFLVAQEIRQIAAGENYTLQSYYTLQTGESIQIPHDSWDLAFTAMGLEDAGIHVNESSELSIGEEASSVLVYATHSTDFDAIQAFDEANFTHVLNSEENWHSGATNVIADKSNPLDYGWGVYNPTTRQVEGHHVYVIKLRDNSYKKFKILSLSETTYTMRYANLDGSYEKTIAIDKTDFTDTGLAFFSFETDELFEVGKYDLSISRYSTLAVNPMDNTDTLEYTVTGILSSTNTKVAEIRDVSTADVDLYTPSMFSEELHVIGHDWKTWGGLLDGWLITEHLSYIVQTSSGDFYKIVLHDFEGSTTGVATFEQTLLEPITSVENDDLYRESVHVFPNPADEQIMISYELKESSKKINISITNMLGQVIWQANTFSKLGLNARQIDVSQLTAGHHFLKIQTADKIITKPIQIN